VIAGHPEVQQEVHEALIAAIAVKYPKTNPAISFKTRVSDCSVDRGSGWR